MHALLPTIKETSHAFSISNNAGSRTSIQRLISELCGISLSASIPVTGSSLRPGRPIKRNSDENLGSRDFNLMAAGRALLFLLF